MMIQDLKQEEFFAELSKIPELRYELAPRLHVHSGEVKASVPLPSEGLLPLTTTSSSIWPYLDTN